MKIIQEETLNNFKFWSGAKENAKMLTYDELEQVTDELEALNPDGMTDTEINDLFWFDLGYICELIGLEYDEENDEVKRG